MNVRSIGIEIGDTGRGRNAAGVEETGATRHHRLELLDGLGGELAMEHIVQLTGGQLRAVVVGSCVEVSAFFTHGEVGVAQKIGEIDGVLSPECFKSTRLKQVKYECLSHFTVITRVQLSL